MVACKNCQKETKNPNYCSRSCATIQNNKKFPKRKIKRRCIVCGELVSNYRKSRCDKHTEEYKLQTRDSFKFISIDEYISRPSIKDKHPSWKYAHIRTLARSWFKHLLKEPCKICGYNKHVELAHIKPINKFSGTALMGEVNHPSNIMQLCRNCHWECDHGLSEFPTL